MISINAEAFQDELTVSAINPFEPSDVEVFIQGAKEKQCGFLFVCSHDSCSDQLLDFGVMRARVLMASQAIHGTRSPTIKISIERGAVVHNLTDLTVDLRISCPVTKHESSISVGASKEQQMGISSKEKFVVIEVGVRPGSLFAEITDEATLMRWSSQVRLSTEGDLKPCIIPFQHANASSLAGSYLIELKKENGILRIAICPQIVVLNSTVSALRVSVALRQAYNTGMF